MCNLRYTAEPVRMPFASRAPVRRGRSGLGRLEDRRSLDRRGECAERGADELDAPGALFGRRQLRPAARMAEAMAADDAVGPDLAESRAPHGKRGQFEMHGAP